MKVLFSQKEFDWGRNRDMFPLECEHCGKTFYLSKRYLKCCFTNPNYKNKGRFCSNECKNDANRAYHECQCLQCGVDIKVIDSVYQKSKNKHFFCSQSCAATYNNTHKTKGTRVSKLEMFIQKKLTEIYPDLEIHFNKKDAIGSELDIYIPSMKLAFELNGLFHYEPVFGEQKFKQIQENDENKFQACQDNGISLCVIDTSCQKYFKEKTSLKYLNIITEIVDENLRQLAGEDPLIGKTT